MSEPFNEADICYLAQCWSNTLNTLHKEALLNQEVVIRAYIGGTSCVQTCPYQEAMRGFLAESKVAQDDRR
jgi:hypothetical protein